MKCCKKNSLGVYLKKLRKLKLQNERRRTMKGNRLPPHPIAPPPSREFMLKVLQKYREDKAAEKDEFDKANSSRKESSASLAN